MKLESYTPSVRGNVQQASTRAPGDLGTRGGNDASWGQLGRVAGVALEAQLKQQEDDDALRVVNAQSEYMRRVNEVLYGEGGMAYRTGELATHTRDDYRTAEKNIREQVLQSSGIQTQRGYEMFSQQAQKSLISDEAQILGWEEKGRQQWIADTAGNTVEATLQTAIHTGDIQAAYTGVEQGLALQSRYFDDAGYEAARRKGYTDVTTRMVGALIESGNYTQALAALERARKTEMVAGDVLEKLESAAKEKKSVLQAKEQATDFAAIFRGQGKKTWEITREEFNNVFDRHNAGMGSRDDILRRFLVAIGGQESGGNYEALNATNAASGMIARGKYQIIDSTWQQFAPQAGLSADAPQTPENQEKVALAMAEYYYDLTGGDIGQMAACWYCGSPVTDWSEEALNRQQISDDGTPHPSIRQYMDSIVAQVGDVGMSEGQRYEMQEQAWNAFRAQAAEEERVYRRELQAQKDQIDEALDGMSPAEQLQFLKEQTAGNADLQRAYRQDMRALAVAGEKIQDWQIDGIKQAIARREIVDQEDLTGFFERNGLKPTFAQWKTLSAELTAANEGTGKYQYAKDMVTKAGVLKLAGSKYAKEIEANWAGLSPALTNEVVKYQQEHQGQMPPQAWLEQTAVRLFVDNVSFAHHPATQMTRAELGKYGYAAASEVSNERGEIFIRLFTPDGRYRDVGADQLPEWLDGVRSGAYGPLG
ncbi:MAG: hypothetical protein MR209_00050 [Veillonellaceae bacterium]|nr:hypothetical protein [Veillonellaceae bacterium]